MNDKFNFEEVLEKALGHRRHDEVPEEVRIAAQNHLKSFRKQFNEVIKSIHFSAFPTLEPGERILYMRHFVRAVCVKSLPAWHWFFSLPPITDAGLYVTDRRVLVKCIGLRLISQEFSQWYPETSSTATEFIREVRVAKGWVLGPYVEVVSESTVPVLLRSRQTRIRYHLRSPELVRDAIPVEKLRAKPL
jgi:hypothetical protein